MISLRIIVLPFVVTNRCPCTVAAQQSLLNSGNIAFRIREVV